MDTQETIESESIDIKEQYEIKIDDNKLRIEIKSIKNININIIPEEDPSKSKSKSKSNNENRYKERKEPMEPEKKNKQKSLKKKGKPSELKKNKKNLIKILSNSPSMTSISTRISFMFRNICLTINHIHSTNCSHTHFFPLFS